MLILIYNYKQLKNRFEKQKRTRERTNIDSYSTVLVNCLDTIDRS